MHKAASRLVMWLPHVTLLVPVSHLLNQGMGFSWSLSCLLVIKFCVLNFLSSRESINVHMIFKYLVIFQLVKNLQGKEITGHAIMQCKSIKWECIHWQHLYFHLLQSCAISLNTIHFYAPLKHAWHSFQLLANAEKLKNITFTKDTSGAYLYNLE